MALQLENLDTQTRALMLEEFDRDMGLGMLYVSDRLTPTGKAKYPDLLRDALTQGTDDTLAQALWSGGCFNLTYTRRTPSGGTTTVNMPENAPETLAQGEFNRFYIRGVCRSAAIQGNEKVQVYRARASAKPRPESEAAIGTMVDATALLTDLRTNPGRDTALGVPNGVNSGLSVRLAV